VTDSLAAKTTPAHRDQQFKAFLYKLVPDGTLLRLLDARKPCGHPTQRFPAGSNEVHHPAA